jgi:hypothetical protein
VFAKPFGYFGGGYNPNRSTVDRIDYANDTGTASVRSPLSLSRGFLTAAGNSNFGYFIGGWVPGATARVDRIDYANDNTTASVRGPLSSARVALAAAGTSNFSWIAGRNSGNASSSTVDRIDYSNDSATSSVRGPLSSISALLAATGNSNFGYFGGGQPGVRSTVDRIDYSNDSATASVRGSLSSARYALSATGNSNFGYFGGGRTAPSPSAPNTTLVDRIDYSNDTTNLSIRGPLSLAIIHVAAAGNQNFGYFGGGSVPGVRSTVDRIDYSNDTATASVRGPLSLARSVLAASSATAFGGALDFTPTQQFFDIQSMRRIEDTTNESVKKRVLGSYGYFGGGSSNSTVDRIDYSNDLATASIRSPLLATTYLGGAAGNTNYGYYLGGFNTNWVTFAQRIDYSNDLTTPNNRFTIGSLDTLYRISSTGNQNQGFFGGSYKSNLRRINYSNDTSIISSGTLELRWNAYATGNNNFGYFGGGGVPGGIILSSVDRISYSNSSTKSLIRGPLAIARIKLAATGNSNFGYFGGGWIESPVIYYTTVERIDYSNDTVTLSIRSNFPTINKVNAAATGNSNFGYFGSGSFGNDSVVYRVDYSNDTNTPSTRGPLSVGRGALKATTNARSS